MSVEENQISVIAVANSTEEQFEGILTKVDAMTEVQAAELFKSLINEISEMQKDNNGE